jgi:ribose 5-phosphate isomerase A
VVAERIGELGGEPVLRDAERKDGPVVTDDGSLVLDCDFGDIEDPGALAASLSGIPGVVEHGLFVDLADVVYVGTDDGVRTVTP